VWGSDQRDGSPWLPDAAGHNVEFSVMKMHSGCVHHHEAEARVPFQAAQLDLIRRSTSAIQADGGRLVELIRCCLLGPHDGAGIPEIPVAGSDQAVDT